MVMAVISQPVLGAEKRAMYLKQVAQAADNLGYAGALLPTRPLLPRPVDYCFFTD
jgi:alkanesulfonate monooxygenase SsuD/methylene tetrahydromethanopterin reductase-like flavin-dependent oxidoreductase (luciferase family)